MAGQRLQDDIWTRRGISLPWDAEALSKRCTPRQVVRLRRFLELHALGWLDDRLSLVNDHVLVVAGLERAIDALPPEQTSHWWEQVVYKAIISYQREVADGGNQAALVLWITENRRLAYQTSDDSHDWHCGTQYRGQTLLLSRCLFNGAERDLRRIETSGRWIGVFHPRIS